MGANAASEPVRTRPKTAWIATPLVLLAILAPYARRLAAPSLYADDVVHVAFERNLPLWQRLITPFNEHLAPLFEMVSSAAWWMAGGKVTAAPLVFTIAGILPFSAALWVLGRLVTRETNSRFAGLASMVLVALVPLHAEVVGWFSASSFAWALLAALLAVHLAGSSRPRAVWGAGLSALAAPAFSAIGLLAGVLACARLCVSRRWRAALVPVLGTALYLFAALPLRHQDVLTRSAAGINWTRALPLMVRAPVGSLALGVVGLRDAEPRPLKVVDCLACAALIASGAALAYSARHDGERGLIVVGLVMILGGYALTVLPRAGSEFGNPLRTQRYQLFPVVGLALVLAPVWGWLSRRFGWDRTVWRLLVGSLALAAALGWTHASGWKAYGRFYRFPDQAIALAAIERFEKVAIESGVSREALIDRLPDYRPPWFDHPTMSPWQLVGPLDARSINSDIGFNARLADETRAFQARVALSTRRRRPE